MEKDYNTLLNEYNILVAQLKELQDQTLKKNQMWSEYEAKCDVIEKHARKLCEMILAKDRDEMTLGTAKSWHSFSTDELIQRAMNSFTKYTKERTEMMQRIMDISEERAREIDGLKEQMTMMLTQGNIFQTQDLEALMKAAEKQSVAKESIEKAPYPIRSAIDNGKVEVIIEDIDELEENELEDIQELMKTASSVKFTPNSIPNARSKHKIDAMKKAEETTVITHLVDLQDNLAQCGEMEWNIFDAIGQKGLSRYQEIEATIMQNSSGLKNAIRNATTKLTNMGALQKEIFKLPISSKCVFFRLSDIGKRMYKHHFGIDAVTSELEAVTADHDNGEHGYGILEIHKVLEESNRYLEISSFNRTKAISVNINGQQLKYIPDLLCKSKKGYTEYIEYERGTHNQVEFNMKLNKMCKVTKFLNIIVPNKTVMKEVKTKVDTWINSREANTLQGYHLFIGTVKNIKDGIGYTVEYQFSKSLEAIKAPF